ncbi:MAG: hypothetical protein IPI58_09780 [Alphaproteobacteria bacterium]|nr:MAG: hypothetical protein IPI58_09780 [Alphaproteobacteria bacterium]
MTHALAVYIDRNYPSRAAFAASVSVSPAAICRYIHGQRVPGRRVMARIVDATGGAVRPEDFFGLPSAPPTPPVSKKHPTRSRRAKT